MKVTNLILIQRMLIVSNVLGQSVGPLADLAPGPRTADSQMSDPSMPILGDSVE